MVLGSLLAMLGFQTASLGLYAKIYARVEHFDESDGTMEFLLEYFNLERGILVGLVVAGGGLVILSYILVLRLRGVEFGGLLHLREAILAMVLVVTGVQTVFSSFFLSMMGIARDH